jgi:hypothetical protein
MEKTCHCAEGKASMIASIPPLPVTGNLIVQLQCCMAALMFGSPKLSGFAGYSGILQLHKQRLKAVACNLWTLLTTCMSQR